MSAPYAVDCADAAVEKAYAAVAGEAAARVRQVCERWGEGPEDVRRYHVYFVDGRSGTRVLKKTDAREASVYALLETQRDLPVPRCYGTSETENGVWLLLEYVPGADLRDMTDALALAAADSVAAIANRFWQSDEAEFAAKRCDDRFTRYYSRILRRAEFLEPTPRLRAAYQMFLDRQQDCPRTLCCGDLLPCNALWDGARVRIVDWGFGGVMPYALDLARFTAHATPERSTFPFFMTDAQKRLFLDRVYRQLDRKPAWERFLLDIELATLNEYVEFMEADEDESGWYRTQAERAVERLLGGRL